MMLSVEGITAGYGRSLVLRDVSIDVPEGSIATLLGPNGTGKTTLLRVIAGSVKPRSGQVKVEAKVSTGSPPERTVRADIAHIPEGRGGFPGMSVQENLLRGVFANPQGGGQLDEAAESA